jgi:hypothetical protein
MISRILKWHFIDTWRDWNAPADRLTRYEIWRVITGGLFVASPLVMWIFYEHLPPLAVLAATYFICFPTLAGIASIIHDPPRSGPNTERCGGEN